MSLSASNLSSLFESLFGDGSMLTLGEDGRWTFNEIPGFPKLQNEGILTYVFRLLNSGNVLFHRGVWSGGEEYPKNSLVSHDGSFWVANFDNTDSEPSLYNSNWSSLLYSLEGLQGEKGDSGDPSYIVAP